MFQLFTSISPKNTKGLMWGAAVFVLFAIAMAFIKPWYNVWSQEMEGKAEFAKAEQNRKIRIEEARANHEAEKLNAQAEIERAKGAAEAIRIGNGSVTPTYIQYLWVLVIFINICIYVKLSLLLLRYILHNFIYTLHL